MRIYNIPGSDDSRMDGCIAEDRRNETENKFVEATAELVCEILKIGWNDRRIVQALLVNGLKEKMDNRWKDPGFLQQYGASKLDLAAERLYSELGIPKDVTVNHDNADHAKYANIAIWIRKNYKGPEPIPMKVLEQDSSGCKCGNCECEEQTK